MVNLIVKGRPTENTWLKLLSSGKNQTVNNSILQCMKEQTIPKFGS